jgi:hypothetical protein
VQGDVIGVGYRPRTGTIFFTRNGKKLEDVVHGLKNQNFFPAVGANGPCIVHVNFGQAGFVFIEANVKKWGLAPVTGSLAPPPPYGSEQGSILLETGRKVENSGSPARGGHGHSQSVHVYSQHNNSGVLGHTRSRSGNYRVLPPTSPGPVRSPTDISLAHLVPTDDVGEPSGSSAPSVGGSQHVEPVIHSNVGLGLQTAHQPPPPEYTSPEHSDDESSDTRRNSSDSENTPLIHVARNRGASSASTSRGLGRNSVSNGVGRGPSLSISSRSGTPRGGPDSPPIPSYSDAVQQGAGRQRSDTASRRGGPGAVNARERSDSSRSNRRS